MRHICYLPLLTVLFVCCTDKDAGTAPERQEDTKAKQMMQGIWMNEEDGEPTFRIEGDTIYFPDTMSAPVRFAVMDDTLFMYGFNVTLYPIVKQTDNIFEFKNQANENIRLVKSTDADSDIYYFKNKHTVINQRQTIKSDTVVMCGEERYHCYLQVNPTTFKVYKRTYTDEGVEVDNVYYDNSVYMSVFSGTRKLYGHEFTKSDFTGYIPEELINQTILSEIILKTAGKEELTYYAILAIPDSPGSYVLKIVLTIGDKIDMKILGEN